MDFKSLIKKFEPTQNNSKESIRFSTREPLISKKNTENQIELKKTDTIKNFESNPIMEDIYKSQTHDELNTNENLEIHRNTVTNFQNNSDKNNFLTKISIFESKNNTNKPTNSKDSLNRSAIISPPDTKNGRRIKEKNKKGSEIIGNESKKEAKKHENIIHNNDEDFKEEEILVKKESEKKDNESMKEGNEGADEEKIKENKNGKKVEEIIKIEKIDQKNDNINIIDDNTNIENQNKVEDKDIEKENDNLEDEKINENRNNKLNINVEEKEEINKKEKEEINKEILDEKNCIDREDNKSNDQKGENDNKDNDIIEKFRQDKKGNEDNKVCGEDISKVLPDFIYDNIEETEKEKKDEEEKKVIDGKNTNEKEEKEDKPEKEEIEKNNEEIINLKDEKKGKLNIDLKIMNEQEKEEDLKENQNLNNIIINNGNKEDILEENLDISKLIQIRESLGVEKDKNLEKEENLEDYFNPINSNNGFEKTFSNIELMNQNPSLYIEGEMNETLLKLSEKDKLREKGKKKGKKNDINIKNNNENNINIIDKNINNNIINVNENKDYKNINKSEKEKEEKFEEKIKDNNISNINDVSNSEKTKQMKDLFDYDEDENLYKTFNSEEFPIRRYDSNTIDSGKKFFKLRFIKNKLEKYLKFSVVPISSNKLFLNKSNSSSFGLNHLNNSNSFLKKTLTFQRDLTISNMNSYDKEKEIRIYSSEFLKIVEKSIFSFNLKKYKESYGYLLKNGIIYNPEEYGEFLFVVSGFDKNIIGDFLSKNHFPNDKKETLNSFTSCIDVDFPQKKLCECARFLFSKVILPKDANLILEIINSFSIHYFNDNKTKQDFLNIFKSSNNIYLLLSTILAINTMFIRTDIRNLNAITKEEFINMNKEIDSKVVENIYLELKDNPISMIDDDYSQNTYKKLSQLVIEKTKIEGNQFESNNIYKENNNIIENKQFNEEDDKEIKKVEDDYRTRALTFSLSQNFQEFTKADKEVLTKPIKLLKFCGKNSSHIREFLVYDNFTKLIWTKSIDTNKLKGNIHFIMISDIIDVFNGIDHSEIIQNYFRANKEKEKNNFITIISKTRQIDLKADNLQSALAWFKALKSLVIKLKNKEEKKYEKQNVINNAKLKNKIGLIWKNSILPKWGEYGDYILFKNHEKKNDLFGLKFVHKNRNINNIINVEKISTSKKIELILKETENKKILSEHDFFILYNLGLPSFIRPKLWKFLIGNPSNISKKLYDSYVAEVEIVNFESIDTKYHEDINEVFSCDYIINQMIIDIIKIKDLFLCELLSSKTEQNKAMLNAYRITRTFFALRNDLTYNKNIIPLIFIFLILGEDEFSTFSNIYNLICGTNIIKYLLGDEHFIKNSILFFIELISQKAPRVWEHFKKLEITAELYLIPWFEEVFTSTLNYKILLRVLDLYLLNGDYFLYQVGLTIIKIQEEDILNSTISEVFRILRRLPNKYKEDFFLDYIKEFNDVKEKYFSWNKENILGEQKQLLFQDFYDEEE